MIDPARARKLTETAAGGVSGRGVSSLCRDEIWNSALEIMVSARTAAVITGFFIPSADAPETDGPPGSAALARALELFGIKSELWTDFRCVGVVKACAEAIGFPAARVRDASENMEGVLMPDLLVYVERLGRADDGAYYDMRGNDLSAFAAPLDEFALLGRSKVIGVGDGGNETGMGSYKTALSGMMPGYARCLCSVAADAAIPADVSNWGAYALCAALSIEAGRWLGHSEDEESAMADSMIKAGAVDGITKTSAASVDGFDLARQQEICRALRGLM
jgi:hypothetical protein